MVVFKDDWEKAPWWAKFAAMDADGDWYWYESEPTLQAWGWRSNGRYELIYIEDMGHWTSSLTTRN